MSKDFNTAGAEKCVKNRKLQPDVVKRIFPGLILSRSAVWASPVKSTELRFSLPSLIAGCEAGNQEERAPWGWSDCFALMRVDQASCLLDISELTSHFSSCWNQLLWETMLRFFFHFTEQKAILLLSTTRLLPGPCDHPISTRETDAQTPSSGTNINNEGRRQEPGFYLEVKALFRVCVS